MRKISRFIKWLFITFIFDPIAGGNGKVQMDELAKAIILVLTVWSVTKDGNRVHEWSYFSDAFYMTMLGGLFAIAAIKPIVHAIKDNDDEDREDNRHTSDSTSSSSSGSGYPKPESLR